MNIYIGNIPYSMTEGELKTLFEEYGQVLKSSIIKDRDTGRSKGFGFVEMSDADEAEQAIGSLNGKAFGGRTIAVNEARPRS